MYSPEEYRQAWQKLRAGTRASRLVGWAISLFFIAFFSLWGMRAELNSAAIAPGQVVVDSNRKTVQHFEGGIIEEIFVKEGDYVEEGQVLIRLSDTIARATRQRLSHQLHSAAMRAARLIAERDGGDKIQMSVMRDILPEELKIDEARKKEVIDAEARLFISRKQSFNEQMDVLRQRILQLEEKIGGWEIQKDAVLQQEELIKEELDDVAQLLEKGLVQKGRVLALRRTQAELQGRRGEYMSNIASSKETISETKLYMSNVATERSKEIVTELTETQKNIEDFKEQLQASQDVLARTAIVAPQAGIVTGMRFHNKEGVIRAGEPVLDIVPQDDRLIIEAQVSPQDIDVVRQGLKAEVMLSAYRARFVPRLKGEVVYVSADRFTDEHNGTPYFKARIGIDPTSLEELPGEVELYPGMPAETFIVTGARTPVDYFISPITASFHRSLREQ